MGIKFTQPENYTGFNFETNKIKRLKKKDFVVEDIKVGGDAPKIFIRAKFYEHGRRRDHGTKKNYIAKVGHKWYCNESITEHLLNRLGKCVGVKIANSQLKFINGQLYFLSEYFLQADQQLIHGAEIYRGFYKDDSNFVEEIEEQKQSKSLFTFQETQQALSEIFGQKNTTIYTNFVKMLLFDAFVGNNDRHFYNWGVVRHVANKHEPYFSPIYDTARGLFWNKSEESINSFLSNKDSLESRIEKYAIKSTPKLGCSKTDVDNHFDLVKSIYVCSSKYLQEIIKNFISSLDLNVCFQLIDEEFISILSSNRMILIKKLLKFRHLKLLDIVK